MEQGVNDILNKEGFFFQKYCRQKIEEAGWIIDVEEYPISENESFDIKANLILHETVLNTAAIECKRQDPTRKYWIFYRKEPSSSESKPFLIQIHFLGTLVQKFPWKDKVLRGVLEVLDESKLGSPSCHTIGIEVFKDDSGFKANPQIIRKACLTAAKGINHLFDSEAKRLYNTVRIGQKNLEKQKREIGLSYFTGGNLIPIVITSAPLFSVAFDPSSMDMETFKVPYEESGYEEEKWLVYEFPLPLRLRYHLKDVFTLTGENRYAKMHVFIVNGRYTTEFFRSLTESLGSSSQKSYRTLHSEFMEFYEPKKNR